MATVSEFTLEEIADVINIYDKVGDGKLAIEDIVRALRALDMNPASNDWDEVIEDFKDKKVTRIDISEFASIYEEEKHRKACTHKELAAGLMALDPGNGELGAVNRATLVRFLTLTGDTISDADAEYLVSNALEQGGKNVNIDKIVKLVMSPVDHQ